MGAELSLRAVPPQTNNRNFESQHHQTNNHNTGNCNCALTKDNENSNRQSRKVYCCCSKLAPTDGFSSLPTNCLKLRVPPLGCNDHQYQHQQQARTDENLQKDDDKRNNCTCNQATIDQEQKHNTGASDNSSIEFSRISSSKLVRQKGSLPEQVNAQPSLNSLKNSKRKNDAENNDNSNKKYDNISSSSTFGCKRSILAKIFPIIGELSSKSYSFKRDLLNDILAGLTIGVFQVPQGMAYALLAGAEPIHGLYVSFIPVMISAFLSELRYVSFGTFAGTSIMFKVACESLKRTLELSGEYTTSQQKTLYNDNSHHQASTIGSTQSPLVLIDNHKPRLTVYEDDNLPSLPSIGNKIHDFAFNSEPHRHIMLMATNLGKRLSSTSTAATTIPTTMFSGEGEGQQQVMMMTMPSHIEMLSTLCLLVGLFQLSFALLRLGIVSFAFSESLVSGFTTASAFHVITSQLKPLFDIEKKAAPSSTPFSMFKLWYDFVVTCPSNANGYTVCLSAATIVYLLLGRFFIEPTLNNRANIKFNFPFELLLMATVTSASSYFNFGQNYNIKLIGTVPLGFANVMIPRLDYAKPMLIDALLLATVIMAMIISIGATSNQNNSSTGGKTIKMNGNREFCAAGISNIGGSLFSCFPSSVSLSRSSIQGAQKPKSQLCALSSCCLVLSVILYFAPFLSSMPRSTLSCVVVVSLARVLMQFKQLTKAYTNNKLDALVWICTFSAVVTLDMIAGLGIGLMVSLAVTFCNLLKPRLLVVDAFDSLELEDTTILENQNANDTDDKNISETNESFNLKQIVRVLRITCPICYINKSLIKDAIVNFVKTEIKKTETIPRFINNKQHIDGYGKRIAKQRIEKFKFLIIDCSAISLIDLSGVTSLTDTIKKLKVKYSIAVYLAQCPQKLISLLKIICSNDEQSPITQRHLFSSLGAALEHVQQQLSSEQNSVNITIKSSSL